MFSNLKYQFKGSDFHCMKPVSVSISIGKRDPNEYKEKSMNIRERKINSSYSHNLMIIVNVTEDEVPLSKRLTSSQYKQKKLVKTDGFGSCLTIKIKT